MTSFTDVAGEARSPLNGSENPEAKKLEDESIALVEEFVDKDIEKAPPLYRQRLEGSVSAYLPGKDGKEIYLIKGEQTRNHRINADVSEHDIAMVSGIRSTNHMEPITVIVDVDETHHTLSVNVTEGRSNDFVPVTDPVEKAAYAQLCKAECDEAVDVTNETVKTEPQEAVEVRRTVNKKHSRTIAALALASGIFRQ